ncbi:MAG: MGMT family protein [Zestosphaera sp.]
MKFLCIEETSDGTLKTSFTEECFREAVKTLLMIIPLGKVTSYSKIAKLLETHPRNIAKTLKDNDEPIITPCHRVVYGNRLLGGYTIKGKPRPDLKKKLLHLEGVKISNNRIPKEFFIDELL